MKYFVVEPCKSSAGFEIKLKERLDLALAKKALRAMGGTVAAESQVVLLAKIGDYNISVYGSGRMMVKSERKMRQAEVEELAEKIVKWLEGQG